MVQLSVAETAPERAPFHDMLVEFYVLMVNRNPPEVAAQFDTEAIAQDFWNEVDDHLLPNGRLVLAHADDGALIGYGTMRKMVQMRRAQWVSPLFWQILCARTRQCKRSTQILVFDQSNATPKATLPCIILWQRQS